MVQRCLVPRLPSFNVPTVIRFQGPMVRETKMQEGSFSYVASLGNGQVAGSRNDHSPGIDCDALLACRLDSMA
jgi:hypothetical protein